jgi:hypothetical protein|tara:strand:- start:546 stop:698 length:153 start_codon:yes stop_codon:yes gene_type:complete
MSFEEAVVGFADWYEACLESGILPEQVVAAQGEMMLLTDYETIRKFDEFC